MNSRRQGTENLFTPEITCTHTQFVNDSNRLFIETYELMNNQDYFMRTMEVKYSPKKVNSRLYSCHSSDK